MQNQTFDRYTTAPDLPKKDIVSSSSKKMPPSHSTSQLDALDSILNQGSGSVKNLGLDQPPTAQKSFEKLLAESRSFRIPELPRGRIFKFSIYSTWGDAYYVGLNGIELFDDKGEAIVLRDVKSQIRADPPDINCLPGYGRDPRTVDKIVDGTYLTCDDLHVWLTPFTQGREHIVEIDFKEVKAISMVRIWNYNKSRIHSYRGARDVTLKLDESLVFLGEVAKAPGSLKGARDACEYIMFTENESILNKIEKNDWLNRLTREEIEKTEKTDFNMTLERPMTGTRKFDPSELRHINEAADNPLLGLDGRPLTMVKFHP